MKLLIILLIATVAWQSQVLRYVEDPEARCLDGTRATYYHEKGFGTGAKNFILYFEGGGWIQGNTQEEMLEYAYNRTETNLGSSKFNRPEVVLDGIFSRNETLNPEFYNWNFIYINYCDGTGHQGFREAPIRVKDKDIYIRGDRVFKSILFTFEFELFRAQKVLLTGCSAGGLAVFTWAQYLRDRLPLSTKVLAAPDSGVFLDLPSIDGSMPASDRRQKQYMKIANEEIDPPNEKCVAAFPNEKWKCSFAEFLVDFIEVPIFFVQSWYDAACIPNILRIYCEGDLTLTKCNQQQVDFIENQHKSFKKLIDYRVSQDNQTGVFAPACLEHCFLHKTLYYSESWAIPSGSGTTIEKSLREWVRNQSGQNNHQDLVNWPGNPGCSNVKSRAWM